MNPEKVCGEVARWLAVAPKQERLTSFLQIVG